ncbi:GNAT family N-acetyltransferase [Streptosporangium sp. NBC_01755]|uniref:GNAT family N-acetyltransferase n=1 Tax=Streptosporangium sp. NBC_01755 TaxID=2975949 RepID=UPI002DD8992E|nr:GNAT family protein [Streptosporangium sp. NBC_01755]WSD03049.1 GNAT family N-acetyltransferase [Streptosporangium sp. NBC_01755]
MTGPKKLIFPHTASRRVVLHPASGTDQAGFAQIFVRTGVESVRPAVRPGRGTMRAHAAFHISTTATNERLGFAGLHALDPAGHVRCAVYLDPQRARLGVGSEAILLMINYAFATLNVDRVIGQTTEASFASFGITGGDKEIGALRDHMYFRGRLWDLHNFEIERPKWEEYIDRNATGVLPPPLSWRAAPPRPLEVS